MTLSEEFELEYSKEIDKFEEENKMAEINIFHEQDMNL